MKYLIRAGSLFLAASLHGAPPAKLDLKKGDHVAIIGNALAERMQHSGWVEALAQKAFAEHQLVFRNLGFAGDEVAARQRSENFGSPDEWLKKTQADVVFAMFGFNESFKGDEGIEKFKADLDKFIKETKQANYSGRGPARLVLFAPIAHEKIADPNLADPAGNNTNLQNYTAAMADVAKANEVQFVDLFALSQDLYKNAKTPLTHNGIHLTDAGYQALAPVIFEKVFGAPPPPVDPALEKVRAAVMEKNRLWFSRYRTVDGYNVYGGRSQLAFQGKEGQKLRNFDVMQEEMAVRDVMTANRDQRIWAVAKGGDVAIDDRNVPKVTEVKTNKPDVKPYLSGEEAIKRMTVPKGVKVNLFASEEEFPELANPVQMAWDTKGRLWVAVWPTYPERTPWDKKGDSLLVFEDTNGDGKADKMTNFLSDLNSPTGFQFYKDGVLVMQAPDLWFVRDTNGDGKADWKERVLNGIDSADSHHTTNAMCLEPGGATYLSDGVFHRTQVETATGVVRNQDGAIYRYEPRTHRFEAYIRYGFANPHGRVFDYWGNDIVTDATGNANYFGPAFSGRLDQGKHANLNQFWNRPSRPCPHTNYLSSRAWPEEFNGNFLNCNVISIQGIFRAKVTEDGSGLKGETLEHLVTSDDPNFRPIAVSTGPEGAVYFLDWSNAIIGHMQHHIRDPNRDHQHGRIYRMTHEGRPLLAPPKIDGQPIEALLELLKMPENDVRERAKVELGKHDSGQVAAAAKKWAESLDRNDPAREHHLLEALWVHQWHNVVDQALLKQLLASPEPRARAQAVRVLGYWRDRVPEALAAVKTAATDDHPRVRLEAVRVASFFDGKDVPAAIDAAYTILGKPTDYYLDYTLKVTLNQLNSLTRERILPSDPAIAAKLLEKMNDAELSKAPATEAVLLARLERKSLDLAQRERTLSELAALHKTDRETELVAALQRLDHKGANGAGAADELGKLLSTTESTALAKVRTRLANTAVSAQQPAVRRAAWAAVITADAKPDTAWAEAGTDQARQSLVEAISFLPDPSLRAKFQPVLAATVADAKVAAPVRTAALAALPLMGAENAKANFAALATRVREGQDRTVAARALMQLPPESWNPEVAGPLVESILTWAKTVPAEKRTAQEFIETIQAGSELATLLPPPEAIRIRKELRSLSVSVFVVKTVREQMRYDTSRLVVEAGKPFEVIIENVDLMPHNFVVVQPGTRQAVSEAVQLQKPDELDKKGRAYVPLADHRVLEATKMLEAGEKTTLKMTAPPNEGEYEYVCTFPGHWMIMWGKLVVTKNVDTYLQANPQPKTASVAPHGDHHVHR